MKILTQRFSVLLAALLLVGTAVPATAQVRSESHIQVQNETDLYTWITAYGEHSHSKARGAWCVRPHSTDRHGLSAHIDTVRAELSVSKCQGAIIRLDKSVDFVPGKNLAKYIVAVNKSNSKLVFYYTF